MMDSGLSAVELKGDSTAGMQVLEAVDDFGAG
jgi:hypothetical protein